MKFKNKFNINEYIQVVNEIADGFFDIETGEYYPHMGEIQAMCIFYNHCAELERTDPINVHPITMLEDMQVLLNIEEFVKRYNRMTTEKGRFKLDFTNAYNAAMEIVRHRNNDATAITIAIEKGVRNALKALGEMFSVDDVKSFMGIASQIADNGDIGEAIVKAYENSNRFTSLDDDEEIDEKETEFTEDEPEEKTIDEQETKQEDSLDDEIENEIEPQEESEQEDNVIEMPQKDNAE